MLKNRHQENTVEDVATAELYRKHLVAVRVWARRQRNCRLLEGRYADAVAQPLAVAGTIAAFVGGGLDVARMAAAVDASLYRNRADLDAAVKS